MKRILIVEDELIPADYFKKILLKEGYDVVGIATKGADAVAMSRMHRPDIILMDIMLADGISGTEAALVISREQPQVKIIFLTAYAENQMLDMAQEARAYAYLVKPYREREIIATIGLAARQPAELQEPKQIALVGGYSFDPYTQRLFSAQREIELGPVALRLIALLCATPYSSISIENIMHTVWGREVSQQTLRSQIHRIREQTRKDLILNVNKVGYRINLYR